MHVSTRALGASDANIARAAIQIVEYLERGTDRPPAQPTLEPGSDGRLGRYYADASDDAGQWLGRGVGPVKLTGRIDSTAFERVLLGRHPASGEQLVGAVGSSGRATLAGRTGTVAEGEWLTVAEVADALNVRESYVRRLLDRGEQTSVRRRADTLAQAPLTDLPKSYLLGNRDQHGHWRVARTDVERFAASRRPPAVVVGYDVTFSVPKSVSVLWAAADPAERDLIRTAVDQAVAAGMAYLEDHAAFVRVKGQRVRSDGIVAASYLHTTSRALEPQLHRHVVVANMGSVGGKIQALDGASLHLHQKAAAALAGAELRSQLSRHLGVRWTPARNGKADIDGVPVAAIRAMSSRSAQIDELTRELGNDTLAARQIAAYRSRAPKEVRPAGELEGSWRQRLARAGFDRSAVCRVLHVHTEVSAPSVDDLNNLYSRLGYQVTEHAACFDRRDVLQAVADWAGERLSASEVADVADRWLATERIIPLGVGNPRARATDAIRRRDGRLVQAPTGATLYTTIEMLALEDRVRAAFRRGLDAQTAVVPPSTLHHALHAHATVGADQAALVDALTTSGHRIQAAVGPAGTGKTFALNIAAHAWRDAGYRPIGAAVGGTAAEVLGRATGMPSTTVASLLTRLDLAGPDDAVLDERTVVIVDEASTLGNRDLDRLIRHVERAGATLRLIGDPVQHDAVAAGGLWQALLREHPDDAPRLEELRRQRGAEMQQVRLALGDYREGRIQEALQRLEHDARVVQADSADELLDCLVADWYVDRQRRTANPTLAPSSMVAEHHHERRELNRRARALLAADGTLHGPAIEVGGVEFRAGDEVIARRQDRSLRPAGGDRHSYVRNGTRGTIVAIRRATSDEPELIVDFEGRGRVTVPASFLRAEIAPGVAGGLAHSYAVTSYAAQGETYEAARHLATDRSTRAGIYVGLSRGSTDARLYTVRAASLEPEPGGEHGLPTPTPTGDPVEAVINRLRLEHARRLPSELDPDAREVANLARLATLPELIAGAARHEPLAQRALVAKSKAITAQACLDPGHSIVERLGPRPGRDPDRRVWDRAVGAVALYQSRTQAPADELLGQRPDDPDLAAAFDHAAALLRHAEAMRRDLTLHEPLGLEL